MSRSLYACLAAGALLAASGSALGQAVVPAPSAPSTAPVTREEFDKMMKDMADMRAELAQLKAERAAAATQPATAGSGAEIAQMKQEITALKAQRTEDQADAEDRAADADKAISALRKETKGLSIGYEKLLITGDADVGFTAQKNSKNSFEAGVAPRFLWKLTDQLMFDAGLDIGVGRDDAGNNTSETTLSIASMSYIVNDYLVVGGGLFVAPLGAYHRDYDPSWINKLPDDPLAFSDNGLGPSSVLGAFVSGAYPIGTTKVNYMAYLSNGPELMTGQDNAGSLGWDNYQDLNNNKAVGGRVGFLPLPELEIGYSFLCGQASAAGAAHNTNAFVQAVDFNYTRKSDLLKGTLSLRSEWIWSHVGDTAYNGVDAQNNPWNIPAFANNRNGGYVQFAYRPTDSSYKLLRNLEGIIRYDRLDGPSEAPSGGGKEQRLTLGVNYWIDARSVVKVAYEWDKIAGGGSSPTFMVQFGVGF